MRGLTRRALLLASVLVLAPMAAQAAVLSIGGQALLVGGKAVEFGTSTGGGGGGGGGVPYTVAVVNHVTGYAPAQPVFQRTGRGATGPVPYQLTFTGTLPSGWKLQVVNAATSAVIVPAFVPSSPIVGSGTVVGTFTAPVGSDYLIQFVDPATAAVMAASTQRFGVGVRVVFSGQSNQINTMAGPYYTNVPGTSQDELTYWEANKRGSFFDLNGTHGPGFNNGTRGPNGSSVELYGNPTALLRMAVAALSAKYGRTVPVSCTVHAFGATGIGAFSPGGSHWTELFLGSSGTVQGSYGFASPAMVLGSGDFEAFCWHQGEADSGSTMASYRDALWTLAQAVLAHVAQFGRVANDLLFSVAVLGNYAPTACPNIENIRQAEELFVRGANAGTLSGQTAAWSGARVGWTTIDLWRGTGTVGVNPPNDDLHFNSVAMQQRSFRRAHQTLLAWCADAPYDGSGPSLPGTYSRSGSVVTLDVTIPSGTTLAPAAAGAVTGWYANTAADFTGTNIAVSAAVSGGNKVAVTFPGGTTFPVYLKHCGGRIGSTTMDGDGFTASCFPDIRNLIYDTAVYPTGGATGSDVEALGLPLRPSVGAVVVT